MANGLDTLHNRIEALIATALVDAALARGYAVTVWNGEEYTLKRSQDRQAILDAMSTTDDEQLRFHHQGKNIGSVVLIYGNGEDVISDWTVPQGVEMDGCAMDTLTNEIYAKFNLL